jgi:hypothetical protein
MFITLRVIFLYRGALYILITLKYIFITLPSVYGEKNADMEIHGQRGIEGES